MGRRGRDGAHGVMIDALQAFAIWCGDKMSDQFFEAESLHKS